MSDYKSRRTAKDLSVQVQPFVHFLLELDNGAWLVDVRNNISNGLGGLAFCPDLGIDAEVVEFHRTS